MIVRHYFTDLIAGCQRQVAFADAFAPTETRNINA